MYEQYEKQRALVKGRIHAGRTYFVVETAPLRVGQDDLDVAVHRLDVPTRASDRPARTFLYIYYLFFVPILPLALRLGLTRRWKATHLRPRRTHPVSH